MNKSKMLIVGAGFQGVNLSDKMRAYYDLHTLDIDAETKPHTVGDMRELPFEENSFDAVLSSHCLEHVISSEVYKVLCEMHRVLKPGGELFVAVPNLELVCEKVLSGESFKTIYAIHNPQSDNSLAITALDMMFGWGLAIVNNEHYLHKTGFTRDTLSRWLSEGGLKWDLLSVHENRVTGDYDRCELQAYGIKLTTNGHEPEFFADMAKDCDLTCGDPFRILTGENLERYKKEEKEDEQ